MILHLEKFKNAILLRYEQEPHKMILASAHLFDHVIYIYVIIIS
jgi:hypothetical protein